ncbi:MAG TPA: exodeoxyribonuclease VII large subunit [Bacillaceae bacterium]
MTNPQYLTVKALTKYIKRKFEADPYLAEVMVKGEISNFKKHSSGHMYFTLKDDKSKIMAVMFAASARTMKFFPENGMNVLVKANVAVYEGSGQYQLYIREMQPDGIGELFLAFEQLKSRLEKEGMFCPERKRPVPAYPKTIGIITSPTGAAIRDIITTIKRRYTMGKILLIPALVQGPHAAPSIADAIRKANERSAADVLIVGRGGGSIEELWAFNEEEVARAIFESSIPVISAVGHETDFTIADFVADLRAPTPTAAAELAAPHVEELMERLLDRKRRLIRSAGEVVRTSQKRFAYVERSQILRNPRRLYEQKWEDLDRMADKLRTSQERLFFRKREGYDRLHHILERNHPSKKLELAIQRQKNLEDRMIQQMQSIHRNKVHQFSSALSTMEALSPMNTLRRGFSVAYTDKGALIKSGKQVQPGDKMELKITDGRLYCTIDEIETGERE